ncbi:hypothetical protein GCM10008164_30300 [Achromobacter xylosoxidans]|nr:hypothetical protein GCM10008164_30300 [Achromobacter xylosoxidans]
MGAQLMPGEAGADMAVADRVEVAFMGGIRGGRAAAVAADVGILRGPSSIDKLFIRIESI